MRSIKIVLFCEQKWNKKAFYDVLLSKQIILQDTERGETTMIQKRTFFVLLLFFLLAGCGSASASGRVHSSPTALRVVRVSNNPYGSHIVPFNQTITDTTGVQRLYTAIQQLPDARGTYNCPKDIGLVYHLSFLQGTTSMQQMDLQASGCQFLRISKTDTRITNASFLSLFTTTIGIASIIPKP